MVHTDSISSVSSSSSKAPTPEAEETTQIFVKDLSGSTFPLTVPTTTTIATLKSLIALRTNATPSSLRLVYAGKHLTSSSSTLASSGITAESTLHVALPLKGGVASRRPKCEYNRSKGDKRCTTNAQPIIGDCGFCKGHFCSKHRQLEDHACTGLEDCKKESRERNADKLNSERTVAIKGV